MASKARDAGICQRVPCNLYAVHRAEILCASEANGIAMLVKRSSMSSN